MNRQTPTRLSDADIIRGILQGGISESKAIEAMFEQSKTIIIGFLNFRTTQTYAKTAEDIIWEGMAFLVNNIKSGHYEPQNEIGLVGYFKAICKNLLLKNIESESARVNRQSVYAGLDDEHELDVSQAILEKESWEGYVAIFEQAGKNCRRILELTFADNLPIREVAKELIAEGLYENEQVVRNAKSKCLKRIKELI